ncbi:hypothetical protein DSM112329_05065 [Paraconexibacter sp. AEG42_29]|uniref:Ferric siderophore reductase C-terminal domain-containing protein n=1 Tax=Paraconexibacter sp. AEG42_29 TaxID=2997339 RepID=A0AAU7B2I4_9ACTN
MIVDDLPTLMASACTADRYLDGRAEPPAGDGSWVPMTDLPGNLPGLLDLLNTVYGSTGYRTPAAVLQATIWWTVGAHAGACLVDGGAVPTLHQPTLALRMVPGQYGMAAGSGAALVPRADLGAWLRGATTGPLAAATTALADHGGARERLLWSIAFDELVTGIVPVAEGAGWDAGAVAALITELTAAAEGTPLAPRHARITRVELEGAERARWERSACCRRFDVREGRERCLDCPAVPVAERHLLPADQ